MRWRLGLAALSGGLIAICMAPWALWPVAFVALVPLLLAAGWPPTNRPPPSSRRGTGEPMAARGRVAGLGAPLVGVLGLTCGLVAHLGGTAWALPAVARFQHVSVPAATPFFLLFVLWQAVPFGLFAAGVVWLSRPASPPRTGEPGHRLPVTLLLAVPALWVVAEWAVPRVIPWYLGTALAASPLLRQSADLGGVYGLSFLVVLVNVLVASAFAQRRAMYAGVALLLVAATATHGAVRRATLSRATGSRVTVAVVQGALESGQENLEEANATAWSTYAALTRTHVAPQTDLVVWPETVLRVPLPGDAPYRARVVDLAAELNIPILLGALDHPRDRRGELNSAYLINPQRAVASRAADVGTAYHKRTLLPFGEFVPGAALIPVLGRWRTTGEFVPGGAPALMGLVRRPTAPAPVSRLTLSEAGDSAQLAAPVRFAPSICLEAAQPGGFNELVAAGAQFLVNVTDDGWFGDTGLPAQHLQATVLRAVETRRWLVRASNSGISAVVDPTGAVVTALPFAAAGVLTATLTLGDGRTPYVTAGNWIAGASLLCLAGLLCRRPWRAGRVAWRSMRRARRAHLVTRYASAAAVHHRGSITPPAGVSSRRSPYCG